MIKRDLILKEISLQKNNSRALLSILTVNTINQSIDT